MAKKSSEKLVKEYYVDFTCDNGQFFFDTDTAKLSSDSIEELKLPDNCVIARVYARLVYYSEYNGQLVRMVSQEKVDAKNICIGRVESRVTDPITKEVEHAVLTNRGRHARLEDFDHTRDIIIFPNQIDENGYIHLDNSLTV